MGNIPIKQFIVEPLVDLQEEIFSTTVEDDPYATRSEEMQLAHHAIFFPSRGIVAQFSQTLGHIPIFGKWKDIHATTYAPASSKNILVAKTEVEPPASHAQS